MTLLQTRAVDEILGLLLQEVHTFAGSEYPRLEQVGVRITLDPQQLAEEAPRVRTEKQSRRWAVEEMTEDNTAEFCACIECRPFSLGHTCILTPERMPVCGARSYASIKAAAHWGSQNVPWKRPGEKDLPMRSVFDRGKVLDATRGEYEGLNRAYQELTGGRRQRVFMHSLRDFPHTSCGCFQALAFWIEQVQGIGIMSRGADAVTPLGQTWEMLANRAGGKQSPGIMGVSLAYIRSRHFLKGDGGIANVVWVNSGLFEKISGLFAPEQEVATENDAASLADLVRFIKKPAG